jgi:hypothetical protein
MPVGGSIIGISAITNASLTAGSIVASPTINGTVLSLTATIIVSQDSATTTQKAIPCVAGNRLGVKITTSGDYAPARGLVVLLLIELNWSFNLCGASGDNCEARYISGHYTVSANYSVISDCDALLYKNMCAYPAVIAYGHVSACVFACLIEILVWVTVMCVCHKVVAYRRVLSDFNFTGFQALYWAIAAYVAVFA